MFIFVVNVAKHDESTFEYDVRVFDVHLTRENQQNEVPHNRVRRFLLVVYYNLGLRRMKIPKHHIYNEITNEFSSRTLTSTFNVTSGVLRKLFGRGDEKNGY